MPVRRLIRIVAASALVGVVPAAVAAGGGPAPGPLGAARAAAATVTPRLVWTRTLTGAPIRESSPVVATLDGGGPAVVVGSLNHDVYAVHLADGSPVAGWPVATSNEIDSSPSVADVDGSGQPEVFIGSGSYDTPGGAYYSFTHDGRLRWRYQGSDPNQSSEAVFSTPALGDVNADGVADATAGALGLQMYSLNAVSGGVNPGWPYYTDDTVFSSPALADLNGNGQTEVVIGGDSTPGGTIDHRGGLVRALDGAGHVIWQYFTDEIVRSSPSVADLDGSGLPEIAFGTGDYWAGNGGAIDSTYLFVLNHDGSLRWKHNLGGYTLASPALADLSGGGKLDVIEPTAGPGTAGQVWALDANGNVLPGFPVNPNVGIIVGGVSTADLTGSGAQDILVATGAGLLAYDGGGHQLFTELPGNFGMQNTPLVTVDPDGSIGITLAGSDHSGNGVLFHYAISTGKGIGALSWPMFRHDPRRTGDMAEPPLARTYCPATGTGGYRLAASDGGVFAFCGSAFYGSMGGHPLAAPIVGMAATPDGRGYWLVASDGGIFTFGDAVFHGSTGAMHLAAPIVGMAATPDGRGYWLVASDGGIFTFGDAVFRGSTGAIRLNQPIVGMAPTPTGAGYWLVASDGGIFTFGDAVFHGSAGAIRLARPVVGMAVTADGGGYWLVASDGGIFTYGDAPFLGSTGALPLAAPIVGMTR